MRRSAIIIGPKVFSETEVKLIFTVITVLLFIYVGGYPVLYITAVGSLIALAHAALRQRSVKSKGTTAVQGVTNNIRREFSTVKREL